MKRQRSWVAEMFLATDGESVEGHFIVTRRKLWN